MANRDYGKTKSTAVAGGNRHYGKVKFMEDGGPVYAGMDESDVREAARAASTTPKQSDSDAMTQSAMADGASDTVAPATSDTRSTKEKVQDFGAAFVGQAMPNKKKRTTAQTILPDVTVTAKRDTSSNAAETARLSRATPKYTPPATQREQDQKNSNEFHANPILTSIKNWGKKMSSDWDMAMKNKK